MDVEIVYEAIELFNRESLFWSRLESKGTVLPLVKVEAKYILLFYQTFNLAAGAAIRLYSKGILEDLKWNYIEVQQHIFPIGPALQARALETTRQKVNDGTKETINWKS